VTKRIISIISFSLIAASAALAQEAGQTVTIEPVVISASRWEENPANIPERVTTVNRANVEALPARDAVEALAYTPGVIMDSRGGPNAVAFPMIEGSEFYQTTVLINGIPLNNISNGVANLGQVPAEQIDRMEVLRGPSGSEWGSAIGGVINVMTHMPDRTRNGYVKAGGGEYGAGYGAADVEFADEKYAVAVGGGYRTGAGKEGEQRANNFVNGFLGTDVDLGAKTSLFMQGYTFQGDIGSGVYRDFLAGYYEKGKYATSGVGATLSNGLDNGGIKITGYAQRQRWSSESFMVDTGSLGAGQSEDTTYGGSAIWRGIYGDTTVTAGAEGRNGKLESDSMAEDSYTLGTYGAFVKAQQKISDLLLQCGARYSNEDFFGNFTGFNVGALYKLPSAPVALRFTASTGYTTPPLVFRYLAISDYWAPNPDLQVEKVLVYQAGVNAELAPGLIFDAHGFFATLKDAISTATNDAGLTYYKNFAEFERKGVEAELKWTLGVFNVFANTLQQEVKDKTTGEVVQDKIRATHSVGVGYNDGSLSGQVAGNWQDWNPSEIVMAKDKVWLIGVKAAYTHPMGQGSKIRGSVSVYNATDAEMYTDIALPTAPPRQFEASVEWLF
jgi:vitamin B12 transporter